MRAYHVLVAMWLVGCTGKIETGPGTSAPDAGINSTSDPGSPGAPPPGEQLTCPTGGDYCGAALSPAAAAETLYHCAAAGAVPARVQACSLGCTHMPAGTNDFCAVACPTGGDYCGDNGVGGPAGFLFHCGGSGGHAPTSYDACNTRCLHEPSGVNDLCANGCSAAGGAALQWEADQLAAGNSYSDLCLGFANSAYKAAGMTLGYLAQYDALDALNAARATGRFVNWNGSCPCGGLLFWSANTCNGNYGHIVICTGDGFMSTSGWPGFGGSPHQTIAWMSQMECNNAPAGYILP